MYRAADIASRWLGEPLAHPGERKREIALHAAARTYVARAVVLDMHAALTFGQRAADAVATFGGSWTFIILFGASLLAWVMLNFWLVGARGATFDPDPYILLNLFLSMLAVVQALIILMSQNRQSLKDRISAEHDYEVKLKAELEIVLLHQKLDALRERQWADLVSIQAEQTRLLGSLVDGRR